MRKAKLKKIIRKLEKQNLELIAECNAARARAGEWYEAAREAEAKIILANWPSDERIRKGLGLDG